jgi:GntR family transcriptional regulator/MocR family aminotransferase
MSRKVMDAAFVENGLQVAGRGAYGGSSFWMRAPDGVNTETLARKLSSKGVLIEPGHAFFAGDRRPENYYRMAYSSIPASRIAQGIRLIAEEIGS